MERIIRLVLGPFLTNTYIIFNEKEAVVIDPVFEPERILTVVAGKELKAIINTHGHIDHIQADFILKERTRAKILIHQDDAPLLSQPSKNLSLLVGESIPNLQPDWLLTEGDEIPIGQFRLKVIHTPGHTDGSICLLEKDFVFTGDTLFIDSIGRTDLPGGSEEKIFASLKKLSSLLTDEMVIYPGHGDVAKFKKVKRINPFLSP
jgi:glyoxylase-like metal-dependent hydrolase (beta-lactamase superfamily II)